MTGNKDSGAIISIIACLIQALVGVLLNGVLSVVVSTSFLYFAGYADNPRGAGILWGVFAAGVIFLIGLVGTIGAGLGGLIGSQRLLRRPFAPGVQSLADTVVDDDQ
jgi:hypothetical protein